MTTEGAAIQQSPPSPLRLTIELVPQTCWYSNMRAVLPQSEWDVLRRQVYAHYRHRCGVCGARARLHCHEIWHYDDHAHVQTLRGFIALCEWCHHIKHIGLAGILASRSELDYESVVAHFLRVNRCDRATFDRHRADAFAQFEQRSRHDWRTDLGPYASLVATR